MLLTRKIEIIKTADGIMLPVFKSYEWQDHVARMCYITSMRAGARKGPIVHSQRTSIVTCIEGYISLEYIDDDGFMRTIELRDAAGDSYAVMVPPNIPVLYANTASTDALILSLPDIAWHPNSDDSTKYDGWDGYSRAIK